jgi:hypothetical protein
MLVITSLGQSFGGPGTTLMESRFESIFQSCGITTAPPVDEGVFPAHDHIQRRNCCTRDRGKGVLQPEVTGETSQVLVQSQPEDEDMFIHSSGFYNLGDDIEFEDSSPAPSVDRRRVHALSVNGNPKLRPVKRRAWCRLTKCRGSPR